MRIRSDLEFVVSSEPSTDGLYRDCEDVWRSELS